jgi:hypothetical protein
MALKGGPESRDGVRATGFWGPFFVFVFTYTVVVEGAWVRLRRDGGVMVGTVG